MVVKIITELEYFYKIIFVNNIAGETNKSHFRSNKCTLQNKHIKIIQQRNRKKTFIQDFGMCLFKCNKTIKIYI